MKLRVLLTFVCVGAAEASIIHPVCIRGGSSESASAWSAGSKLSQRRPAPGTSYRSPPAYNTQVNDGTQLKEQFAEAFLQREDRNRFIARVYGILTGQLLFTAGTIHLFHLNPQIRDWMLYSQAGRKVPLLGLLISTIAWWIALSSEQTRQSSPMRWPILLAFTAGESIAVGFISSVYNYNTVLKAVLGTGISTLSVTAYTLLQKNPKYDLSQWGRALSGLGMAFLLYGLIHVLELFGILPRGFLPYTEAIYSILGAGLFNLYLAHHTRLIVSGKSSKYQMNEKDYILGAMSVYSDIINIFLYILRLLGDIDDRD
jgi:FtsH-binding integral membrane protein